VVTDSMAPTAPRGSLAVITPTAPRSIVAGDVIAFRDPENTTNVILHRVAAVGGDDASPIFTTQGDGNERRDPWQVAYPAVTGELRWSVPKLGQIVRLIRPPFGVLLLVVAPALVLVAVETSKRRGRAAMTLRTSPEWVYRGDPPRPVLSLITPRAERAGPSPDIQVARR
jgi:signal peptidase